MVWVALASQGAAVAPDTFVGAAIHPAQGPEAAHSLGNVVPLLNIIQKVVITGYFSKVSPFNLNIHFYSI